MANPGNVDNNNITVEIFYSVTNTGITDDLTLNFA